jgi:protein-S-isoprenylcysteine O-methyltransferase Ste14
MNAFLILVAVLAMLFGVVTIATAQSAIHEIAAYVCFLLAVIAIIGLGVIDRLDAIKKDLAAKV